MAIIRAFKGFRPAATIAARVASRPYDVMNRAEAKAAAQDNPHSFLHIIRAEIDVSDHISAYDTQVYEKAKSNFDAFVAQGILTQDAEPCLYVYAQTMHGNTQTGLVCCTSIDDYLNNVIKKHEFTRPKKEQDRITHISTTGVQTGPVLMAYPHVPAIDTLIDTITSTKATYNFTANDGVGHTFWLIDDQATIQRLVSLFKNDVPAIYIADGHHRAASSTKVGLAQRANNANHTGNEAYNTFLSVLFPDKQLNIIDYNRVVSDLNGYSASEFLAVISKNFTVEIQNAAYKPDSTYNYGLYLQGTWYKLSAKAGTFDAVHPIKSLGISVLSDNLLAPILGIVDQRTDDRIDFVGGIRGLTALEQRVNSGEMQLAFAIYPVSIQQLIDVANSGQVMPPKSTWFEPKLRSGLVSHVIL